MRRALGSKTLRERLTLTRVSVFVGMVASVVGIAAAFGLTPGIGNGDQSTEKAGKQQPAASKPIAGAVYAGETDQQRPIHFRVWLDGRTIRELTVPLEGECSDDGPLTTTFHQGTATGFVITGGILSGSSSVTGRRGEIASGIFRINARFGDSGRTVSGTATEYVENVDGSTCDTPEIRFTAAVEDD